MLDDLGYADIRERILKHYERNGAPCSLEELQNICYFIAILAHGTPDLAVRNFPLIKQAAVWEILHYVQVYHFEDIRRVRLVRDRVAENARCDGMTAEEANVFAKVVLYREFLQMPYPTPPNGQRQT